jgi:DNA polymerase elongation subunit (family B)
MRKIEERTGYLDLLQTLCEATSCFPNTRGLNPTRQIEGFMMRLGKERDIRFPTRHFPDEDEEREEEQFEGAYRVEPRDRGILRNVHVADFERMYPSILISWNMSPETWAPYERVVENPLTRPAYLAHLPLQRGPIPEGHCVAAGTELVFRNEPEGILAAAVGEILKLREVWESKKKDVGPGVPRVVGGEPQGAGVQDRREQLLRRHRLPGVAVLPAGGSRRVLTQTGVWLIQQVEDEGKKRGIRTSYIDTDSLFVMGCTEQAFGEFVEHCNTELFPLSSRRGRRRRTGSGSATRRRSTGWS